MPRINPAQAPYQAEVGHWLGSMMPPDVAPLLLFRTLVRNLPMAEAMGTWGSYELGKRLSLPMRDREILIDRTCARCGCEYEWGVHITFFAHRVGLTSQQVASLTQGRSTDPCWSFARERVLIDVADALHDQYCIDDGLWERVSAEFSDAEVLDVFLLCGWYHGISFAANGLGLEPEVGAPRFADIFSPPA